MLKLSERERKILVASHLRAELSPTKIAKDLKLQERTVRYHLNKLLNAGVIRKAPFLNVYPLGLRYFNVYFSHDALDSKCLEILIKTLKNSDRVSWLAELGGDYNFGLAILAKDSDHCLETLYELASSNPGLFLEKEIITHKKLSLFPASYLAPTKTPDTSIGYGTKNKNEIVEIDQLDHLILKLMSKEHLTSVRAIARKLGKAHTSINLRINRLYENNIISGEWYPIDSKRLGYQTLKLLIYSTGATEGFLEQMRTYVQKHPSLVYLIECLGSWDIELGLDLPTDGSVSDIVAELTDTFREFIHTIKVVPMFRVLKWDLYPVDELG